MALIVGAGRGIGLAIAHELGGAGYSVAAWARSGRPAGPPAGSEAVDFRAVDVRDTAAIAAEFQRMAAAGQRPDVVVYAAAVVGRGAVGEVSAADWREVMEVNVTGAHAVLTQFVRCYGGHPARVIGLTSVAALRPAATRSAYATSKAALAAFLEAYREEARPHGTLVTVMFLGAVNTTLSSRSARENLLALQPADVANVVAGLVALPARVEVRSMELSSVGSAYG